MVEDEVGVHGGCLGNDVLQAELQPFVECYDSSSLEVNGVEHPQSGLLCLIQLGDHRSEYSFRMEAAMSISLEKDSLLTSCPSSSLHLSQTKQPEEKVK